MALKAIYEVLEYLYVLVNSADILGVHFLGMQGDQWDTQKDMLLALIGGAIAMFFSFIKNHLKAMNFTTL